MDKVRLGIIGLGNMGSGHLGNYLNKQLPRIEVTALCDINPAKLEAASKRLPEAKTFTSSEELIRSGLVDAIIIATPHYFHPTIAIDGFKNGLNVMSEKPAGVYTKAVKEMNEVAKASGKVFGVMFNQRTDPAYQKVRKIVQDGTLGYMKRAIWIITNWTRSQSYYDSGDWRATWAGEGGGVLLNQCPHQLDLMQWICGVPKRVRAAAYYGKYHNIEVEDDVTAYFEYANGATGLFITTTGEMPATNRLEINGDKGKLVLEDGKLKLWLLDFGVQEFLNTTPNGFPGASTTYEEITFPNGGAQHVGILNNFADAILDGKPLLAPGYEGINGLTISNAIHYSSWTDGWVDVPFDDDKYYELLQERIKTSKYVKKETAGSAVADLNNTFRQ